MTAALFGSSGSGISLHGFSGNNLTGLFEGDVQVNKNLTVTGTKNFVQAHPTDPSREIVYVALEGGEAGTYVRGPGQLINGKAVIALPEHFGLVTAYEDLTIQLTPRGEWLQLHLVELDPTQAVVPLSLTHLGVGWASGPSPPQGNLKSPKVPSLPTPPPLPLQ